MENMYYIYVSIIFFAAVCCVYRLKIQDVPSRIFTAYVCFSLLTESTALFASIRYKNNMPVYAIYSLFEFGFISLYFNNVIDIFKRYNIGYIIGAIGIVYGIVNVAFVQGLNMLNSYFLIFEGICIIAMGLLFFMRLFVKNELLPIQHYHHFWLTTILIFFWAVTLINWSLYNYFLLKDSASLSKVVDKAIVIFCMCTYLAISFVFIRLPKMQQKYAQ